MEIPLLTQETKELNDEAIKFAEEHEIMFLEDIIESDEDSELRYEFYKNVNLLENGRNHIRPLP